MKNLIPIILTIVIAGAAGFAAGRATSGLDARMAASGAAIAAAEDCAAFARGEWPIGAGGLRVEARTFGADCADATAVLVILNGDRPAYQAAFATQWVFDLAGATTPEAMTAALSEWIAPRGARTTGELPWWPEGAEGPEAEFPFYPAAGFDQASYEELRARNDPLFCFPQGLESARCLRAVDTIIEEVGVQSFPG